MSGIKYIIDFNLFVFHLGDAMKIENNHMTIWNQPSHMIMNGEIIPGEVEITTSNIMFRQKDDRGIFVKERKKRDVWDLDLERIKEISLYSGKEMDLQFIRIHYKENDVYFTFPGNDPRSMVSAMIIFINHGKTISRMMNTTKNIGTSLQNGTLELGEKLPKLIEDLPTKVDEECFQCGKPMIDDGTSQLTSNINECLSCVPEES